MLRYCWTYDVLKTFTTYRRQRYSMGLQLEGFVWDPFLNTGTTKADFQSKGNFPWLREALNIRERTGATLYANSFNNLPVVGMSFGPEALWKSRLDKREKITYASIRIGWISGQAGVLRGGNCALSSLSRVKTGVKWSFKILALAKLSVTTCWFLYSEDNSRVLIPFRFDVSYFHACYQG